MKKRLILVLLILIFLICIYFIYINVSFNNLIDNTINYKDKINYSTNVNTILKGQDTLEISYEIIKTTNAKKILLSNYKNKKVENKIEKYIVNNKVYVNDNGEYKELKDNEEKININYKLLKKSKVKLLSNNTYKIKMKANDAYNIIYKKKIMNKKELNKSIMVIVKKDKKNNFIKEISYKIDNLNNNDDNPLIYKIKIINSSINNYNSLQLPFDN